MCGQAENSPSSNGGRSAAPDSIVELASKYFDILDRDRNGVITAEEGATVMAVVYGVSAVCMYVG